MRTSRDTPSSFWAQPRRTGLLLAVLAAFSAALRLHWLGNKSLWIDEAVSVALAQASWAEFWNEVSSYEGNMVFYYLLLRGWIHLGQSEVVLRSLSVLFGVAAIPAIYVLGKRLFNRETGLIGAALLAVHAAHIQFSQEARSYSLLLLLLILSTDFFVRAVQANPARKKDWAAYVLFSVLAVYTHVIAVFILGAQWLSLGVSRLRRIGPKTAGWVLGSSLALAGPMVAFLLLHNQGQLDWIPLPTLRLIAHGAGFLTGGGVILLFLAYAGSCFFAVCRRPAVGQGPASEDRFSVRLLVLSVLFPMAVMLSLSFLYKPFFSYRYLGVSVPAIALLAAYGVTRIRQHFASLPSAMPAALTVLFGCSLLGTHRYYRDFNQYGNDWRAVTRYLLDRAESGDALLFYIPAGYRPFAYYLNRERRERALSPNLAVIYPATATPDTDYSLLPPPQQKDAVTPNRRRIWLVLHHEDAGPQPAPIRSLLPRDFTCAEQREFPGKWPSEITVLLCRRLAESRETRSLFVQQNLLKPLGRPEDCPGGTDRLKGG